MKEFVRLYFENFPFFPLDLEKAEVTADTPGVVFADVLSVFVWF